MKRFHQLLAWHLEHGTRPNGELGSDGVAWTIKEFAGALGTSSGGLSEKTIRDWLAGAYPPRPDKQKLIEMALFGESESRSVLRQAFRAALVSARSEHASKRRPGARSRGSSPAGDPTERDSDLADVAFQFSSLDDGWVGRTKNVLELSKALRGSCRLLILSGLPGVGKTALGERISLELMSTKESRLRARYQENLDDESLGHDFVSVARRWLAAFGLPLNADRAIDAATLIAELVGLLSKLERLIQIDSLEVLLTGSEDLGWGVFCDQNWKAFFAAFLKATTMRSRIIVTSQASPGEFDEIGTRVRNFWYSEFLQGLDAQERLELFERSGIVLDGSAKAIIERVGDAYEGHPLALRVVAGEIRTSPYFGDVTAYWNTYKEEILEIERTKAIAATGGLAGNDAWRLDSFTQSLKRHVRSRVDEAFHRLRRDNPDAYLLLCEASIYRGPVPRYFWLAHLSRPADTINSEIALQVLKDRYLAEETLTEGQRVVKQHNLIRSVALDHLKRLGV